KNPGKKLLDFETLESFVAALERPRRILIMVTAGGAVDAVIDRLKPLMSPGDVVLDCGNSWFKDTQRREADLVKAGFHFVGMGVSGGEEGARRGPSLMPGGKREAYERMKPVFDAIAAKTDSGPCSTYVGPDGAGHFVKMVHNGIEYADMQLIAEAYDLLKRGLGLPAAELSRLFAEWNRGPIESFLIEITAKVLGVKEAQTGQPLVDLVLDKAGQKGTGKWTVQVALDLAVPIPSIAAALDSRLLSSWKDERVTASKAISGPQPRVSEEKRAELAKHVHDALLAAKITTYAQGMRLIQAASREYKWDIDLKEMARIWKGGCIIRARLLDTIMRAYERRPDLPSLLLDADFARTVDAAQGAWRHVVGVAAQAGIPLPAMSASLAYFDSYRTAELPQNLTQAQRDAFGAHTYERKDQPERGFVHTDWLGSA
ncbi:MAG TPA: NADP-dependent phosphogluconate dehydrogenase, partial [Myxococcaceae bacterium]|nr:NADP-dependent phosphogluconate dehydrogenase [Myxococcaceae bacterium]